MNKPSESIGRVLSRCVLLGGILTSVTTHLRAQSCIPAPQGLVSWWSLDGDAQDLIGGNHGTVVGVGGTFPIGNVLQGFMSSGPGSIVSVPDAASLNLTTVTMEAWVRLDGIGAFHHFIAGKLPNSGANSLSAYHLGIISNAGFGINPGASLTGTPDPGKPCLLISDGVLEQVLIANAPISLGVFHHIAAVVDGGALSLYVDGQLDSSVVQLRTPFSSPEPFRIGGLENSINYFPGVIDEVSLYNRGLLAAEIQSIYVAGSAGKCKSPAQGLAAMNNTVQSLMGGGTLQSGPGGALLTKLNSAADAFSRQNTQAAVRALGAFINQVSALIRNGSLTATQGEVLITAATSLQG